MSTLEDKIDHMRQYISSFIGGENADALIAAISDQMLKLEELSIAVNDQLSISTSSGVYVDKRTSEIDIVRPPEIGMEDFAYKKMAIQINADKQIMKVIGDVLSTFYGSEAVKAYVTSTRPEPYALSDGMSLEIQFENGNPLSVTVSDSDFLNINQATAQEISDVINRSTKENKINSTAQVSVNPDTLEKYVQIFGGAVGPFSLIKIVGGEVNNILEFPQIRGTQVSTPDTAWEITRTIGQTYRLRYNANTQPLLDKVSPGDKVMIYGSQFQNIGIFGTFTVTNVRPQEISPSFEAGWFEISLDTDIGLKSSVADVAPPANNLPNERYTYSVNQTSNDDIKFFLAKKFTPYSRSRFSLAWEPDVKKLKIYLPATTGVVQRSLIGAAHLHLAYPETDFNGTFGSVTDDSSKIKVTGQFNFTWPQTRLDNFGSGGTIIIGANTYEVDYIRRESGLTRAFLKEAHGLTAFASQYVTKIQTNILEINQTGSTALVTTDEPHRITINDKVEIQGTSNFDGEITVTGILNEKQFLFSPAVPATLIENTGVCVVADPRGPFLLDDLATVNITEVLQDDPDNEYVGPFMWDLESSYTLTDNIVETREDIQAGEVKKTLLIKGQLPAGGGTLLFGLNKDEEESSVNYLSSQITSNTINSDISSISQIGNTITVTTLQPHGGLVNQSVLIQGTSNFNGSYLIQNVTNGFIYTLFNPVSQTANEVGSGQSLIVLDDIVSTVVLDPSYVFKNTHISGQDMTVLSDIKAYVPDITGIDTSFYVTGTAEARDFAESIIKDLVAFGIQMEIIIVYPSDIGLGNAGGSDNFDEPPTSDKVYVWGSTNPREL